MTRQHGERRPLLQATTLLVLGLAVTMTLVAAGTTRSVRDANERRLLRQRADGVGQIIQGLGTSFEADIRAAAAYASRDTNAELVTHLAAMRNGNNESGTWAVVDRRADGYRVAFVEPAGAPTYFTGPRLAAYDRQLDLAFRGEFTVAGMFGTGPGRRFGIAAGVPDTNASRIIYLEFPLLAVAASSDSASDGAALFDNINMGLYVGRTATPGGLIFGTFEGPPPEDALRATFEIGGQDILVLVDAKAPLAGWLASELPWIVLGFGLAVAALAALVVEVASRKQRAAVALAAEIKTQHLALERAAAEKERAETELREAQKREALGLLAGGIAHDFNNLLAAITGYCDLVRSKLHDGEARADLAEIESAARRGAALTRQLLLFARNEQSEGGVADANGVIAALSPLLSLSAGDDVALIIDLHAQPSNVAVSESELEQVVVNLVVNARHAIPGAGCIAVRTRTLDDAHLVLEVADDGCGMTAEVAARAFDPLFTTRAPGEGTGLGLATVANIVERAGGVAAIDTELDKGTTIRITLPVVDSPADDSPDVAPGLVEEPRATVLLVEDDEPVRRAMARMLERAGCRVHQAASGLDAIDRFLDASDPDVLVTDVIMPGGLSGTDLAERFRTRHPDLAVVFVTGYAPDLLNRKALDDPRVRVLPKPFTERELRAAVDGAMAAARP